MVFHHHRYAGKHLTRDALTALLTNMKRPSATLMIDALEEGDHVFDEVHATPDVVLEAVAQPGNTGCQPPFVNISSGGTFVARVEHNSLLVMEPGPWIDELSHLPHERVPWSWLSTYFGGEGYPPPEMERAQKAVIDEAKSQGEAVAIRRLGVGDVDRDVEAYLDRPGARAAWVARSKRRLGYSQPWVDTGDLDADATTWWDKFVKKINPSADTAAPTEHLLRYSLTEADSLGLIPDDVEEAVDDAVAAHGGETDNPTETGDYLEIPIIGSTTAGLAAAIKALHDLGLISAHEA
ncbi:hypothetical protein [Janibacter melonis]|uniref:hypothetical protein n=1 Tax=Janibacter melonis TaxID=262209 RepID=UPI0020947C51|nr:hypothetical protein [Janibacter melonis]